MSHRILDRAMLQTRIALFSLPNTQREHLTRLLHCVDVG